jgi:hypothetical protein
MELGHHFLECLELMCLNSDQQELEENVCILFKFFKKGRNYQAIL